MKKIKNPFNFIKKANKSFNLYLMNHKKILNHIIKFDSFLIQYNKNQDFINEFVPAMRRLDHFYNNNKEYFFNGEEKLFNEIDTNQFFQMCFFNNIKLLSYSPLENRILIETENGIRLITNHYYFVIDEIFGKNEYSVPTLYLFNEFVVFDIGMNRGYAALKFASFDSCKAVYGFEIDENTYNFALDNFKANPKLSKKINSYPFGLSNIDDEIEFYSLSDFDGLTTTEFEFTEVHDVWVNKKENIIVKKNIVRPAGDIISEIIKNESIKSKIVVKIDTEGSEPKIIDDLISKGLLNKIDVIMGEMHSLEYDLEKKLIGFKKVREIHQTETTYSFCFVKKELFNSNY